MRINTLGQLEEKHIDFDEMVLKALEHSDLQVTTQFLDISVSQVATDLRSFL